jgi:ferredoxin
MQIIAKDALERWLSSLLEKGQVVAPTLVEGTHLFRPICSVEEVAWDYYNSTVPPKEWLFPPTERLFTLEFKDGKADIRETVVDQDVVIFGLRPCDARAIAMLDAHFLSDPVDSLWNQHRSHLTLVGWACTAPETPCFCTSVGGDPQGTEGLDLLLTEGQEGYFVQPITEKGRALLGGAETKETTATPSQPEPLPTYSIQGITETLHQGFTSPYWERQVEACISCRICTFLCPTCYCFDVRDRRNGEAIERLRCWDSCQGAQFSKIAGGYNPRASKTSRWKQFFYHKYLYYPERFDGVIACVGCGRCVRKCPVNIDIREVIRDLKEGIPV